MEIIGARYEVGFAIDFNQHADAVAGVDVRINDAFFGLASAAFRGGGDAFFTQVFFCFFKVAVTFFQRLFTVHHAGAGFFTKVFH